MPNPLLEPKPALDPIEKLKSLRDIDVYHLQEHVNKLNHAQSQRQIRTISQLEDVRNHQAFWVHQKSVKHDMQVDDSPREEELNDKKDQFASPNAKMTHVKSYMMVKGKLIPSINYKAKQKIYNRYKIEESRSQKELITYPALNGPLRLPNIASNNEIKYNSIRKLNVKKPDTTANITMDDPKGKRNL